MSPRHSSFIQNKGDPIFRLSEYQELPPHLFLALPTNNSHQLQLEIKPAPCACPACWLAGSPRDKHEEVEEWCCSFDLENGRRRCFTQEFERVGPPHWCPSALNASYCTSQSSTAEQDRGKEVFWRKNLTCPWRSLSCPCFVQLFWRSWSGIQNVRYHSIN